MQRLEVPDDLESETAVMPLLRMAPVIPVLTIERVADAVPLATALINGGLRVLEVTLRTACALEAIAAIRSAVPDALVGAGTVTFPRAIDDCRAAGALFAATPGLVADLIVAAHRTNLPLLPGIMTPGELMAARQAGFRACKFFPAEAAGGTRMLQAFQAPFPDHVFCPTGGIGPANAAGYLSLLNVACVGGSWVAPADAVRAADWQRIEALAREAARLEASPSRHVPTGAPPGTGHQHG